MFLRLRIEAGDYYYTPTSEVNCGACGNRCAKKLARLATEQANDDETSLKDFLSSHAQEASNNIADELAGDTATELFRTTDVDAESLLQASSAASALTSAMLSFAINRVQNDTDPLVVVCPGYLSATLGCNAELARQSALQQ